MFEWETMLEAVHMAVKGLLGEKGSHGQMSSGPNALTEA